MISYMKLLYSIFRESSLFTLQKIKEILWLNNRIAAARKKSTLLRSFKYLLQSFFFWRGYPPLLLVDIVYILYLYPLSFIIAWLYCSCKSLFTFSICYSKCSTCTTLPELSTCPLFPLFPLSLSCSSLSSICHFLLSISCRSVANGTRHLRHIKIVCRWHLRDSSRKLEDGQTDR